MIPAAQTAVQLVGPDALTLNPAKPVPTPGPHQILGQIECVGLCASDMKLLHQFDGHARKTPVLAHLSAEILAGIPSYVPNGSPTVPGHEVVLRVAAIGPGVTSVTVGGRYLVQADFRDLKTAASNGAFGYNFEGGLQQWVLLDERVTVAANGDSYLLSVPEARGASQIALVEPWACVEDAFRVTERRTLTPGGRLLVVTPPGTALDLGGVDTARCGERFAVGAAPAGFTTIALDTPSQVTFDDIIVAGADADQIERLFPFLANDGMLVIATGGATFARPLTLALGRIHYGNVRLATTATTRVAEALARIPVDGELRPGDHVNVIGAGGPMGVMAMVRAVASSQAGAVIEGGVRNAERAEALRRRVAPFAAARGVTVRVFDPSRETPQAAVDYAFLMAPVAALIPDLITEAAPGGIINLFAGIPANVPCTIDLNSVVAKGLYLIGTSGSTLDDMRVVLGKVLDGQLDTDLSVGAVCGMAGAIAGLDAVRDKTVAGKIVVYPSLKDLPLIELDHLGEHFPSVAALLRDGCWNAAAEAELLRVASETAMATMPSKDSP